MGRRQDSPRDGGDGTGTADGGRRSTCAGATNGPVSIHLTRITDFVLAKEVNDVCATASANARNRRAAQQIELDIWAGLRGRLRSFVAGTVPEGPDDNCYEAVASQPDMWEVRFKVHTVGSFRCYHGEPGGSPDMAVVAFHQKGGAGRGRGAEHDVQNAVMARAQDRFDRGRADRWGHVTGGTCSDCLDA